MVGTTHKIVSLPAHSKGFCKTCGSHVLTLKRHIHFEDHVDTLALDDTDGQAPWHFGDPMQCRECDREFWPLPLGLDWK